MLPRWIDRDVLTADRFYGQDDMPDGAATQLAACAAAYRSSLTLPATKDERTAVLAQLRLQTIVREEAADESRARFRLLRTAVEDVPLDVLEEACAAYARARKFFPTAVSELLSFTDAIIFQRRSIAWRLERLSKQAAEQEAERARIAADPLTPEAMAAIKAEYGLGQLGDDLHGVTPGSRFDSWPAPRIPTEEEARQIAEEMRGLRQRLGIETEADAAAAADAEKAAMLQEAADALESLDDMLPLLTGGDRAAA